MLPMVCTGCLVFVSACVRVCVCECVCLCECVWGSACDNIALSACVVLLCFLCKLPLKIELRRFPKAIRTSPWRFTAFCLIFSSF